MDMLNSVRGEADKTLQELKKLTKDSGAELAAVFGKLKKAGKNTTDGIVKWMKEVKLILTKEGEEKVRADLNTAPDTKDIKFTHFRETVLKVIEERRKELEDVGRAVQQEGGKLVAALEAGTSAFQGALDASEDELNSVYNMMRGANRNTVDDLVMLMKNIGAFHDTPEMDARVRSYFDDVPDRNNVTLDKFKQVYRQVTAERNQASQPVHQPAYQQTQQPAYQQTQLLAYPPSQPPAYQPTQPPVYQPTQHLAYQPTQQAAYQPTQQLAYQQNQQPAYQPTQPPVYQPTQQLAYQPTQPPAYQPTQLTAYQSTQPPAYQPGQPPIYQPTQPPAYQPTQQPAYQSTQPPTQQPRTGNKILEGGKRLLQNYAPGLMSVVAGALGGAASGAVTGAISGNAQQAPQPRPAAMEPTPAHEATEQPTTVPEHQPSTTEHNTPETHQDSNTSNSSISDSGSGGGSDGSD